MTSSTDWREDLGPQRLFAEVNLVKTFNRVCQLKLNFKDLTSLNKDIQFK